MAATVEIQEGNGSGPTWTAVTSARYCTDDDYNPGTNNPIPIPTSGFNYSYWKSHCLAITGGTFTQISNIQWYPSDFSWTLGTNGEVRVGQRDSGDHGCPDASYQQAAGTTGTTGYAIEDGTNGHAYYKDQTTPVASITTYSSSSKMTVDSGTYTSTGRTKHIVTQVKVDTDATQGEQPDITYTFTWDEIILLVSLGAGIVAKLLSMFPTLI